MVQIGTLLFLTGCSTAGILRREESIEASLLRRTPLGSTREAVMAFIAQEGWTDVRTGGGYWRNDRPQGAAVGSSSIQVSLGRYYMPLLTMVEARWAFDSNGKVIDVNVRKSVDAL
jgi:hypothetical protein